MKRFLVTLACVSGFIALLGLLGGPYIEDLPSLCLFHAVTGRRCVFCGMSHAIAYALRGDLHSATAAHPLWFVVLPCFVVFVTAVITQHAKLSWSAVAALTIGTLFTTTAFH